MTSLTDQLRECLAFDHLIFTDFAKQEETDFTLFDCMDVEHGGELENARLAPIHEQLLKCVTLLEGYEQMQTVQAPDGRRWPIGSHAKEALTELRALVEKV